MIALEALAQLHDADLLLEEARDPGTRARLKTAGLALGSTAPLERTRAQLVAALDRRWLTAYDRARGRYGRGLTVVRERVCVGCFIKMPTSATPAGDSPVLCESCARVLYWRA
jgi:predicted  nucleic acid-binding Zn-ribbon protein